MHGRPNQLQMSNTECTRGSSRNSRAFVDFPRHTSAHANDVRRDHTCFGGAIMRPALLAAGFKAMSLLTTTHQTFRVYNTHVICRTNHECNIRLPQATKCRTTVHLFVHVKHTVEACHAELEIGGGRACEIENTKEFTFCYAIL